MSMPSSWSGRRHFPRLGPPDCAGRIDRPATRLDARSIPAAGRRCRSARVEMTERDAPLAQVIGRDFERDFVTGDDANMVLAHFSRGVSDEMVAVIERDAITGIGQQLGDEPIYLENFVFSYSFALVNWNHIAM